MTKQSIRKEMREKRKALSSHEIDAASWAISQKLFQTDAFKAASIIFLYASLPYEVQTLPIALEARRQSKRVAYPKTNSEDHTMRFYEIKQESDLVAVWCGKTCIQEPCELSGREVIPDEKTLIIVPGLAFDRQCQRLGYGGGFYDRYLATYPTRTMGLAFSFSIVEDLPRADYDLPLDSIVTEHQVIR
ncbi:MAG: 5-formyltetrahydrofolate cyclo-ligase [Cellulosilyticaceae bacterium]